MRETEHINLSAKDKKEDTMPTIELLECERVAYVEGMKNYLQKLKTMPNSEAVEKSRISLQNSNIVEPSGDFTERYYYSRQYTKSKE